VTPTVPGAGRDRTHPRTVLGHGPSPWGSSTPHILSPAPLLGPHSSTPNVNSLLSPRHTAENSYWAYWAVFLKEVLGLSAAILQENLLWSLILKKTC